MILTVISIFLFQGLIFLGLIFMLRQFMKGNVKGELGHLQKLHDELMKRQTELKEKSEAAEKEYQAKMTKLEQEITARQAKATQEVAKLIEETKEKSMKEREKIIGEALETRDKMRLEVMAEMEEKAIHYSHDVIAEFCAGELRKVLHEFLMDQLIEGIAAVEANRFQIQGDTLELKVAESLDKDIKEKLLKVLKSKVQKEIKLHEEVEENLIGGAIVQCGSFVIDGSLKNRLEESAARLKK